MRELFGFIRFHSLIVRLRRKIRVIRYKLDVWLKPREMSYWCTCCGKKLHSFSSMSYAKEPERYNIARYEHVRQDVLCPICQSLPRHRILALWCEEHKQLLQSSSILYFAPEYCMTLWMKRNNVFCTTADLFRKANLTLDIQNTGLPENSYEMVIANHVLEHVDNFRAALEEIYRILKPSGLFICSFPMDPKVVLLDEDPNVHTDKERKERFGQSDHKRVFGMKADQFLKDTGFTVDRICGDKYPEQILPVVGPADYDINILFCCKKGMA